MTFKVTWKMQVWVKTDTGWEYQEQEFSRRKATHQEADHLVDSLPELAYGVTVEQV